MHRNDITISIIICTCNRADDLRQTLMAIEQVKVPSLISCEVVVVDNASIDNTMEVVRDSRLSRMVLRYIYEAKKGKGNAYNTGIAAANGEVLLFTDDDVRPPQDWIDGMCSPILSGVADAVASGIIIAPHLERPWMKLMHRLCVSLSATEIVESEGALKADNVELIGANMAFSKRVLEKVPRFDPELGPGALGLGEDTLFSSQLRYAGYYILLALEVVVEHHFEASRLSRSGFMDYATKSGRSVAYIDYHWSHTPLEFPRFFILRSFIQLLWWRLIRKSQWPGGNEGIPEWEFKILRDISWYKQYKQECKRSRNYLKHGLVKIEKP